MERFARESWKPGGTGVQAPSVKGEMGEELEGEEGEGERKGLESLSFRHNSAPLSWIPQGFLAWNPSPT